MGESAKAVVALVMIVGMFGSALSWMMDDSTLGARLGFPAAALGSLGVLIWSLTRKDRAPDLLRGVTRPYFERDGFCFAIVPATTDRSARLDIYYQNRYERPCRAQVVLNPSQQFFLNRRPVGSFRVEVECEGGAFGVISMPWGIPAPFQGQIQSFDVAAHVEYPGRRGRLLRYQDGLHVGKARKTVWSGVLTVAAATGGMIVLSKPALVKLRLPSDVDESVPEDAPLINQTLWRPGDAADGKAGSTLKPSLRDDLLVSDGPDGRTS